jgi:hypothetical protein
MDAERGKQGMSGTLKWLLIAGGALVVGVVVRQFVIRHGTLI